MFTINNMEKNKKVYKSEAKAYKAEIKKSIRRVENLPIGKFENKSLIKLKSLLS